MFIYGLLHPETRELRYVGLTTKTLETRLQQHVKAAGRGVKTHVCRWIRSLQGEPSIVLIASCSSVDDLKQEEQDQIAYFRSLGCRLANHTVGGDGTSGYKWTDEQRAAHSDLRKRLCPRISDEQKAKISAAVTLAMAAPAVRAKLSAKRRKSSRKGVPLSPEHRESLSRAHRGGERPWKCRPILCNETGQVFESIKDAARQLEVSRGSIAQALKRGSLVGKRFSFSYVEREVIQCRKA